MHIIFTRMPFLPSDLRNIKRQEKLKTFVSFSFETYILTSNYSDLYDGEEII